MLEKEAEEYQIRKHHQRLYGHKPVVMKELNSTYKDKTCKSYVPDYEGYIAELEKENAELKLKLEAFEGQTPWKDIKDKSEVIGKLTKAKDILRRLMASQPTPSSMYEEADLVGWREVNKEAEQFLKEE